MHGLHPNIDLSFLCQRELIQVAIGIHDVIFAFERDVTIGVQGHFKYVSKDVSVDWKPPGAQRAAAETVRLLGAVVNGVHGSEDGTLELTFSNGDRLTITDANKEYESYQVTRPGETIVV